jgi:glucosamine-6-phosphate deaminase
MTQVVRHVRYGQLEVEIHGSARDVGRAAAVRLTAVLEDAVRDRGEAALIFATGNSQLQLMHALRTQTVPWEKVSIFHMDEYLGIAAGHPASFRRYMREQLADTVRPAAFFGIEGDAGDVDAELARYRALLERHRPVACVMGIGENGHLAFNDPPADFRADGVLRVVELSPASRRQQVGEGHFARLEDVPARAISLTIPALLAPPHVLVVAPEARKAAAVAAALEGPISPDCPASILRTLAGARLYLDVESAARLNVPAGHEGDER